MEIFSLMIFILYFHSFGSKLLSRELGFIYNNELADFSEFWPSVYNLTSDKKVPGKRPMSKSSPTIFVNPQTKNVEGVFGAAGGFFIPSCMLMVSFVYISRSASRGGGGDISPALKKTSVFEQAICPGNDP